MRKNLYNYKVTLANGIEYIFKKKFALNEFVVNEQQNYPKRKIKIEKKKIVTYNLS